jgi:putative hemolysin
MPADFVACVKNGGKVITKSLKGGKYIHLCKDKQGKWHQGEVRVAASNKYTEGLKGG